MNGVGVRLWTLFGVRTRTLQELQTSRFGLGRAYVDKRLEIPSEPSSIHFVMKVDKDRHLDPAQRAREKQLSRAADAHALASGERSEAELRSENEVFVSPQAPARVDLSAARALA